jgi:hypothetical protein
MVRMEEIHNSTDIETKAVREYVIELRVDARVITSLTLDRRRMDNASVNRDGEDRKPQFVRNKYKNR